MLSFYQHLPEFINPIAFSIGFLEIRWYALMYLIAFGVVYKLLVRDLAIIKISKNQLLDLLIYSSVGLLLGGRLGYVLFYGWSYFSNHLWEIFLPFQFDDLQIVYIGLAGMSYHGGLIGVIFGGYFFARKNKLNFYQLANFIVPVIPAGYFFGRIGNFLNGELYGRATEKWWGMYFCNENFLRHPSQLYEAFFEGIMLFLILGKLKNNQKIIKANLLLLIYLIIYGLFRFCLEFWREPDNQLGFIFFNLTLGQILSIIMILVGVVLILIAIRKSQN